MRNPASRGRVECTQTDLAPNYIFSARGLWGSRLLIFDVLPSTNTWVSRHANELRHGDVVQAIHQNAGRGRFDRAWLAPADRGLTLTIFLDGARKPKWLTLRSGFIAALAVQATLAAKRVKASVKWPNDVIVNGRKIAGILAERGTDRDFVVLGIGLNVNLTRSDLERVPLLQPATSLRIETGTKHAIEEVCRLLLRKLEQLWHRIERGGPSALTSCWRRHDALRKGRLVRIQTVEGPIEGRYLGMDEEGCLLLQIAGTVRSFHSGDVSICAERRKPNRPLKKLLPGEAVGE
ncbi:MAG: biotin--[acetyl-CoA-carboxylase] ligase [Kiritimatiellia bacterium]